jgi:putative FmdB family regulatory protein
VPLYEYACTACGERVEKMKRLSDRANGPDCPTCGETMVLALSAPGRVGVGGGSVSTSVSHTSSSGGCGGSGFT